MGLRAALPSTLIMFGALSGIAACGGEGVQPAAPSPPAGTDARLHRLVDLATQRLRTADIVAAAKWGSGGAIADPEREKVVLDAASAGSTRRGIDPVLSAALFRDQIEANKAVQYGLFSDWSAEPQDAPTRTPDLGTVRPVLDRLTGELLDEFAATRTVRAGQGCAAALRRARDDVEREQHVDDLHRHALDRAVRSICR